MWNKNIILKQKWRQKIKKFQKAKWKRHVDSWTLTPHPIINEHTHHHLIHYFITPQNQNRNSTQPQIDFIHQFSISMAGLMETIAVPRASVLPSASLAPVAGSSLSCRRSSVRFSVFKGLKIQQTRSFSSFSKSVPRRGAIVCEAQDTAVLGLYFLSSL